MCNIPRLNRFLSAVPGLVLELEAELDPLDNLNTPRSESMVCLAAAGAQQPVYLSGSTSRGF